MKRNPGSFRERPEDLRPCAGTHFRRAVWSLAAQGIAVILVEHVMTAVRALCHHVIVMNAGAKIAEGPPEAVLREPEVVRAYLGDDDA